MTSANPNTEQEASAGVQSLINRIRDEGIQTAQQEADRILTTAQQQAAQLVATAQAESANLRQQTRQDIEAQHTAALEALHMAGRDAVLELKARIESSFERYIKRLVSKATLEPEAIRCLLLVLAQHSVDEFIGDKPMQIRISTALFGSDEQRRELVNPANELVSGISADMLREGVELIASDEVQGGARVRLVDEDLEIDLSDVAITQLLLRYLSPRFKAVLEGSATVSG